MDQDRCQNELASVERQSDRSAVKYPLASPIPSEDHDACEEQSKSRTEGDGQVDLKDVLPQRCICVRSVVILDIDSS